MLVDYKIISQPAEKPVVKRSVPHIDLKNVDTLADFCLVYGNFPTLDDQQAREASHQLQKEFNFGPENSIGQLHNLFSNKAFIKSFKTNTETKRSLVYFYQELVATEDISKAKQFLDILIEYTKDENEKLSLRFLKVSLETQLDNLFREFINLVQGAPHPTVGPVFIHYLGRQLITRGQFQTIEPLLQRIGLSSPHIGRHTYPEIIKAIIWGDAAVAQDNPTLAIAKYETALEQATAALSRSQEDNTTTALYQNLQVACRLKLLAVYRETNNFEQAAGMLDQIAQQEDNPPYLYCDHRSKQALWLTLGEHFLNKGHTKRAATYFKRAAPSFHALTRLNELEFAKIDSVDKLTPAKAQNRLAALDREARDREAGEDLALLALQKFSLASRSRMTKTTRQALDDLVKATQKNPVHILVLAYYASLPLCQAGTKRRFMRTRIPSEIVLETPIQREIALTLFGTTEPKNLAEAARFIKRRLAEATPATQFPLPNIAEADIAEMLIPYNAQAAKMHSILTSFFVGVLCGDNLIYSGDVINGFTLLDQAGISSFRIIADRKEKTARVRVTNHLGESFEQEITEDFDLTKINSHPFFHLLTLIIIDFFLVLQLEDAYEPVFASLDYKFFAESEFLQLDRLQEQLHLLFDRVPSESERTIDSLGQRLAEDVEIEAENESSTIAIAEGEGNIDEEDNEESLPLDGKKTIFTYGEAQEGLTEGTRLVINIPKEASLIPLAKLLDALKVEVNEGEINLTFYAGAQEIHLTIDQEGNIAISDYSRGITNFNLIRQLNELVLDLLNAHFNPQYKETLSLANPRRRKAEFRALFEAVLDSKEARDRKWQMYNLDPPSDRKFIVSKVAGQIEHPFETTFFEDVSAEGGARALVPLPEMKAVEAKAAIQAGKKIVQVGIVRIHRKKNPGPITENRINEYILKYVLNLDSTPEDASNDELKQVQRIKNRILAGEATADPNGFLRPDPKDQTKLTMATILMRNGKEEKRTHRTFVKPHIIVYSMMVTEDGTLRATTGRRATRPKPAAKRPAAPKAESAPKPTPRQAPKPQTISPNPTKPTKLYNPGIRAEAAITLSAREMLSQLRAQGVSFGDLSATTAISQSRIILIIRGEQRVNEAELAQIKTVYLRKKRR